MIEYNGYISGSAKKHCKKKLKQQGIKSIVFGFLLVFPIIIIIARKFDSPIILLGYAAAMIIVVIAVCLQKKSIEQLLPKKIIIESEYAVSVADLNTESRDLSAVKTVLDYGDFYVLVFKFGQVSERFVCQKNLISSGTDADFRDIFKGKVK